MEVSDNLLISICIPHWQAREYIVPCLRSIRKNSKGYNLEIIVIDNGSKDDSLDYLKSLEWIKLIERPEEGPHNFSKNVFTAWDRGLEEATGDLYFTMHSDVFVKDAKWLEPFIDAMNSGPNIMGAGSNKLELHHPFYLWQKRFLGEGVKRLKKLIPNKNPRIDEDYGRYPRDYCACYATDFLKKHAVRFDVPRSGIGGGNQVAKQIWTNGGELAIFPVTEMAKHVAHIAHGRKALSSGSVFGKKRSQDKAVKRKNKIFATPWIYELCHDATLDQ